MSKTRPTGNACLSLLICLAFAPRANAADGELKVEFVPDVVRPTYEADASPPYYIWAFETRVTNRAPVRVQVTSFTSLYRYDDEWIPQGSAFGTKEFTEWYTDGDTVEDGWIQPGETAIDARNWNRGGPASPRTMWRYVAKDEEGREYVGAQEVEIVPGLPLEASWDGFESSGATRLHVRVTDLDDTVLPYVQVRIGAFPGQGDVHAAYETATGEAEIDLPLPGLYLMEVYAPGHTWQRVALAFESDATASTITLRMPRHDSSEEAAVEFETDSASAEPAAALYDSWNTASEELFAAMRAYRAEHLDTEGFSYDLSGLLAEMRSRMADGQPRPLRELTALLLFNTPSEVPKEMAASALTLLPPEAPAWGAFPQASMNAAYQSTDPSAFLERLSTNNPDRTVRALALESRARHAKGQRNAALLTELCELLEAEYLDVPSIASRLDDLRKADLLVKGMPAPAFDLPLADGEARVSSASLAGRHYLLHFWATWCGPCLTEMKHLEAAFAKYAEKGVQFVSVTLDYEWRDAQKYREKRWSMPWMHVFKGDVENFDALFGIHAVPSLFLVDPNGVIVEDSRELRGESLEKTLGGIFGE